MDEEVFQHIKYDANGLIPAIVQDYHTKEVLTLAYMNEESLKISLEEKRTCFYSRSRQELWRKGETSGNVQRIVSIMVDCDYDALVVMVEKEGPACHLNRESCFHNRLAEIVQPRSSKEVAAGFSLDALYGLISGRKEQMPENSYTTYLFEKGKEKILKKMGEESTEVIIAAMKENKEETIFEIADLTYHALVLLCEMGIAPGEVKKELEKRHIIDKKIKQETMV